MKMSRFSGFLCISLAMFALPAAAQTTPATSGLCDPLAAATPGLQGLCVAMCEAQACEGELNPSTGEVTFDPSCSPASKQLYANYNQIASLEDPTMPCVKVACPCWTESELDNIGGGMYNTPSGPVTSDMCNLGDTYSELSGTSTDGGGGEQAFVSNSCVSIQQNPFTYRYLSVNEEELSVCQESLVKECTARGLAP